MKNSMFNPIIVEWWMNFISQSWQSVLNKINPGRTGTKAEVPTLWPPDVKSWLTGKDPNAGKDRRQKKRAAEDETVSITDSMDMNLSKLQEIMEAREAWRAAVHGVTKNQTGLRVEQQMIHVFNLYKLIWL